MGDEKNLPSSRVARLVRLAGMGLRSGASALVGGGGGAQHAAEVLGNLRGLAAKVGQMASYVDGMVPEGQREAYELAMGQLRAQAPRSAFADVRALIERELGAPLDQHFAEFHAEPLASASIGQVHAARLHDGSEVAVKVQHPGVEQAIESDLSNAGMLEGVVGLLAGPRLNAKELFDVVRTRFREELDYTLEAERAQRFARAHAGDTRIVVPRVYGAQSTKRVLTSEFVRGRSFEEACAASEAERRLWAETLWRFTFKSMLGGALLHADPHPGNYFFQDGGRVAFLDYGCVQELVGEHRANASRVHRAALAGDARAFDEAAKLLLGTRPGSLERPAIDYLRKCLSPLMTPSHRITRSFAAGLVDDMKALARGLRGAKPDEAFSMPPRMLFVNRLQFGLYSVLARLDVDVSYADVERTIFSEIDGAPALTAR